MYTQIDKGRHAIPCEAKLKAPYTRQASRIDYVNAIAAVSRSSRLCALAAQTKRHLRKGATGQATAEQLIQWGEPTRRIGVTNQMNQEGYHPRPWAPWNRLPRTQVCIACSCDNRGYSPSSLSLPGLARPRPQRELHWCGGLEFLLEVT
jgi:hypothetical protein